MPFTPISWSGTDLVANAHTTGSQADPVITQLSNGNVLISWVDFDNGGAGGTPGADVIGRIFDPLGNPVTGDIRLNSLATAEDERNPEITALAGGGFMIVYEDNGADNNLIYETYTNEGAFFISGYVLNDANGGAVPNSPAVASATATSAMTAYIVNNADGSEDVFVRSYNPVADTFGAADQKLAGFAAAGENVGGIGLTTLSNNNFALAIGNRNAGDDVVELSILNSAGTTVNSATISPGVDLNQVEIAGLTGGNVAIVYSNVTDGTIVAAVYSSTAVQVRGSFQVSDLTGSQDDPAIAALSDGGFVIVWDDDINSDIRGRRFDSTGLAVGSEFIIDNAGAQSAPSIIGLEDGRFQVTWLEDGDIRSEIFDGRDAVNSSSVYTPDQWQVGTVDADVFTANGGAEIVHGWDGNDEITEGGAVASQIFGDAGTDTINVTTFIGADFFDGGAGTNDTINWSAVAETGATFDLALGTATDAALNVETMVNFENLIGTANRDIILGTGAANYLEGGGGDDSIDGGGGADTLKGGGGGDALNGGSGLDTLDGGLGEDTYFVDNADDTIVETAAGGTGDRVRSSVSYTLAADDDIEILQTSNANLNGAINLTGNSLQQSVYGNIGVNILDGGIDNLVDTLTGYAGDDTYLINSASDIIVETAGGGTGDRARSSVSFTLAANDDIEILQTDNANLNGAINLTGNGLQQSIYGNIGINTLDGGIDNLVDTLTGYAGDDTYLINSASDIIVESAGNGAADRARASVSFTLAGNDDIEILQTDNANLNGAINLTGNALDQSVYGNVGSNVLNGGAGNDNLTSYDGADFFLFDTTLNTATNRDVITDFSVADDTIRLENAIFTLLASTGALAGSLFIDVIAGAQDADDVIIYNRNSGNIYYDNNGLTAGGLSLFAEVDNGTLLTAADFVVV